MLRRYLNLIKNFLACKRLNIKEEDGLTLVEVVVAFVIIAIITVVLVRGTIMSVDAVKVNKAKTKALAVANEKMELIKTMNYEDIQLTSENPDWGEDNPALIEDEYDINYEVTEVYENDGRYKQLEISIFKDPMKVPIEVITQIYPIMGVEEEFIAHPPPQNLLIEYDQGAGTDRSIKLIWQAPDTELEIDKYNIYRGGLFIYSAFTEIFIDNPGDDEVYSYYVTTLYADEIESGPSNIVNTAGEYEYPPPQNLRIVEYTLGGNARRVHLEWDPPDTPLTVDMYVLYRDGEEVEPLEWTGDTGCIYRIGKLNYTFFVRAVYEGDIFSEPSNEVTTE